MRWVTLSDFNYWAPRRDCQGRLPFVIRQLIRATAIDIGPISFPADEGVQYSGWDGNLIVKTPTEYIPEGHSVWEISTRDDIRAKAEQDYQKRSKNPHGVDQSKTAYVFVTPRIWADKNAWKQEKIKEGKWRDVRVYDARDLEEWLEQAPGVGAWLASYLKIAPDADIASAEDFWNEWAAATAPRLTAGLVLSGRQDQVETIRKWLSAPASSLTVQAATQEEALAFLLAAADKMPVDEKESFFSHSLIANSPAAFRAVSSAKNPMILMANFDERSITAVAVRNGHHVYIPVGPDCVVSGEKVVLLRPDRDPFITALKEMGVSEQDARAYSIDTGRSLSILRRRLSKHPAQPKWATKDIARDMIPSLLVGRWNEKKQSDTKAISAIARKDYHEVSGTLTGWLSEPDCPIIKIGDSWRLASPFDAWFSLARFVTKQDLDEFRKVTLEVLGQQNPMYDLEPDQRYAAAIHGKVLPHSDWLREGIAQTLILVAVFGADAGLQATDSPQAWVDGIVRALFHDADWQKWSSLSDVMPLLAEASPSAFLDGVESSLTEDKPQIIGMFSEGKDAIFSSSAHAGLLWALEGLAWDPSLLGRVALILAQLSRLDPGGKTANRPANSLREIFLLWYRNTHASVDEKISVLQMLLGREPDIAWKLLVSLIPSSHNYCSKTHDYRWRQVSPVKTPAVTRMELYVGVDKIIGMLIAYARNDETLWAELIERFHDIPPDRRREIAGKLASSTQALGTGANTLRKKLRRLLSHHRSFPDAGWALPETEMAELAKVYEAIEPLDLTDRFSWLFDFNPELPEGKVGNDFAKHDLELNKRRITAIIEILKDSDIDGLIVLVEKVEDSWVLGICAAQANLNHGQEEKILLLLKEGNSEKAIRFVQGYVCWRGNNAGEEWIDLTIASSLKDSWEPKMITNFLVALPENMATWRKLDSYNASTQEEYWKKCWARFYRGSIEEREFGIKKLLSVDRAYAALDIAGISRDGLPKALLVDILEKTATVEPEPDANISLGASHIARLMNILDKTEDVEEAQKIKLEWIYLQIFASDWCEYSPRRLYTELTKNPAFFADVIKFIYKPKDESANNDAEGLTREAVVSRAQRAYELLSSWKTVPGRSPNGKLSYELLKRWVQEARRLCKEAGRGVSGDHHIGQILAHANVEENGCWPPEAVARVIDESNSKEIESGFHVGIVNMRGVTTRSLDEGGMQERELAAHYRKYSKHFATRYPRTAAILSGVADDYDYRAKDEDNEVKRRDIEY